VIVRVEPAIVAGPETTLNTTTLPDAPPEAANETGNTPKLTGVGGAVKVIVCVALLTATLADPTTVL
jgi:hypothetical protein